MFATLLLSAVLSSAPAAESEVLAARIAQERGNIVVVNFWAVWCEPCKREMPMLAKLAREYEPRGVTFRGASIDDAEETEKARAFAVKKHVAYPLVFGATSADMISYRLGDAVPVTAIVDRDGARRFRLVGELKEGDLRKRLDWLIDSRGKDTPDELVLPDGMTVEHFRDMHESGESAEHQLEEQRQREEGGSAVPG